jgi:hypothetical protein
MREQSPVRRRTELNSLCDGETFIPSRSEIEEACEQIRARWNERQQRLRAGLPPDEGIVLEPVSLASVRWSFSGLTDD